MLSNSSGAYGLTISEHILMVTLMLLRRMPDFQDIVRRREWVQELPMRSIYGSRITVLGAGDIGTNFARRAKALGAAHICGVSRSGRNGDPAYDRMLPQQQLDQVLPGDGDPGDGPARRGGHRRHPQPGAHCTAAPGGHRGKRGPGQRH